MSNANRLCQIFISYRRDDSAAMTGRIYDRLLQRFGRDTVFKDVDSIPLGTNFKRYLDSVISQSGVVLVVIGDKWESISDKQGNRLLDKQGDFVRLEIESALRRDIPIIPLLVQDAAMPAEASLPASIAELVYRNGLEIGQDPHFHTDVNRLISQLETLLPGQYSSDPVRLIQPVWPNDPQKPYGVSAGAKRSHPILFWSFAGLLSLLVSLALGVGAASLTEELLRPELPMYPRGIVVYTVFALVGLLTLTASVLKIRSWRRKRKNRPRR